MSASHVLVLPLPTPHPKQRRPGKTVMYGGKLIPWDSRPVEKVCQAHIAGSPKQPGLATLCGFDPPGSTSQYRASHVVEGIADLWLTHPGLLIGAWWETKRPGEMLTPKQVAFRARQLAARVAYGWGTDEDFKDWCVLLGLARLDHARPGFRGVFTVLRSTDRPCEPPPFDRVRDFHPQVIRDRCPQAFAEGAVTAPGLVLSIGGER